MVAYPSGFDTCAVMIIDSVGSPVEHIRYDYPGKKEGEFVWGRLILLLP